MPSIIYNNFIAQCYVVGMMSSSVSSGGGEGVRRE